MSHNSTAAPNLASLPVEYGALCRNVLLPRPIRDRTHYRENVAVADALAGHRLNRDQSDYFALLCDLIGAWERDHQPAPPPAAGPLDVLRHLLEANTLTGADLARLLDVSRSLASRILSGERQLTTTHITALSRRFKVSPPRLPGNLNSPQSPKQPTTKWLRRHSPGLPTQEATPGPNGRNFPTRNGLRHPRAACDTG